MSVGIFKNGKYNKVAGNAKDSTAANTTYNNGTSGLQANNVQSAIDELNSNLTYSDVSYRGEVVGNDDHAFIIIIPNGYKPLSCCMIKDVNNNANSFGILSSPIKNDDYAKCRWKNITSGNVIINVTVRFYFIKK